jgi:putative phosphoribosyl transferase
VPAAAHGVVAFAHGSGSSRLSPRNRSAALALNEAGIRTLLFDLLTATEELDRANAFAVPLLAERLLSVDRRLWAGVDCNAIEPGPAGSPPGCPGRPRATRIAHPAVGVIVIFSFFASAGSRTVTSTTPSCVVALMSLASTPGGSASERSNDP